MFFDCKVIRRRLDCSSSRRDWRSLIEHCTATGRHVYWTVLLTFHPVFPFLSSSSTLYQICAIYVFFSRSVVCYCVIMLEYWDFFLFLYCKGEIGVKIWWAGKNSCSIWHVMIHVTPEDVWKRVSGWKPSLGRGITGTFQLFSFCNIIMLNFNSLFESQYKQSLNYMVCYAPKSLW